MRKWAYYNEVNSFACEWLRELIREGVIVPGEVDGRSINDVCPEDVKEFTQCHWFAGLGVWSYALRLVGWPDDQPVWTAKQSRDKI
jgi:DNA (cytosine-5)-methyltransferase 1